MEWTAPVMIVMYVFLVLFCMAVYDVCNTLHDIRDILRDILEEIANEGRP
jgi:hypothetical protein